MDDFTDRSQFRIDDLLVIPGRLIVVRTEQEIPLQPRMTEVLILLAEKAGEIVSSSRLLFAIWRTVIYDNNPAQKIDFSFAEIDR